MKPVIGIKLQKAGIMICSISAHTMNVGVVRYVFPVYSESRDEKQALLKPPCLQTTLHQHTSHVLVGSFITLNKSTSSVTGNQEEGAIFSFWVIGLKHLRI